MRVVGGRPLSAVGSETLRALALAESRDARMPSAALRVSAASRVTRVFQRGSSVTCVWVCAAVRCDVPHRHHCYVAALVAAYGCL